MCRGAKYANLVDLEKCYNIRVLTYTSRLRHSRRRALQPYVIIFFHPPDFEIQIYYVGVLLSWTRIPSFPKYASVCEPDVDVKRGITRPPMITVGIQKNAYLDSWLRNLLLNSQHLGHPLLLHPRLPATYASVGRISAEVVVVSDIPAASPVNKTALFAEIASESSISRSDTLHIGPLAFLQKSRRSWQEKRRLSSLHSFNH